MPTKNCLFVPGFVGSDLYLDLGRHWPRVKFWLGPATFIAHGYRRLDLDNPIVNLLPGDIVAGGPMLAIYGEVLHWIEQRAVRSAAAGYDWRLSVDAPIGAIAERITALTANGQRLVIVAHSAGGLRAARALQTLPGETLAQVDRLITIGTPWRGSWYAVESLLGRAQSVRYLSAICAAAGFTLGGTETRWIQEALSSMPGLLELFPSDYLQSLLSPPDALDVWVPGNYQAGGCPVNVGKLAAAHAISERDPLPPPSVPMLNLYAAGLATPGPFEGGPSLPGSVLLNSIDGDGVVPVHSAVVAETTNRINWPISGEHARLCSSAGTLAAIADNL